MSLSNLFLPTIHSLTFRSGYHSSERVGIPHTSISRRYTNMNQDKAGVEETENVDEKV
jgi:hypothetical protein